jgi:hypothetical protein
MINNITKKSGKYMAYIIQIQMWHFHQSFKSTQFEYCLDFGSNFISNGMDNKSTTYFIERNIWNGKRNLVYLMECVQRLRNFWHMKLIKNPFSEVPQKNFLKWVVEISRFNCRNNCDSSAKNTRDFSGKCYYVLLTQQIWLIWKINLFL